MPKSIETMPLECLEKLFQSLNGPALYDEIHPPNHDATPEEMTEYREELEAAVYDLR